MNNIFIKIYLYFLTLLSICIHAILEENSFYFKKNKQTKLQKK